MLHYMLISYISSRSNKGLKLTLGKARTILFLRQQAGVPQYSDTSIAKLPFTPLLFRSNCLLIAAPTQHKNIDKSMVPTAFAIRLKSRIRQVIRQILK